MRRTDLRSARKLVRLNRGGLENFPIFFSMTDAPDFFQILSDSSDFFQTLTDFFSNNNYSYYSLLANQPSTGQWIAVQKRRGVLEANRAPVSSQKS